MVYTHFLEFSTRGHTDIHDITQGVQEAVAGSGIRQGLATVFAPSSTSAITTIEYEGGALDDLRMALDELAPPDADYRHNLRWGDGNGHAHLRSALVKPSFSIPIVEGQLTLGTWQQIVFLDFDVRARRRRLIVQIVGEADREELR